jgi:hypothetical protein
MNSSKHNKCQKQNLSKVYIVLAIFGQFKCSTVNAFKFVLDTPKYRVSINDCRVNPVLEQNIIVPPF